MSYTPSAPCASLAVMLRDRPIELYVYTLAGGHNDDSRLSNPAVKDEESGTAVSVLRLAFCIKPGFVIYTVGVHS